MPLIEGKNIRYTSAEKTEAGAMYFDVRSATRVSEQLGMDRKSVEYWRDSGNEDFIRGYELAQKSLDDRLLKKMRKVTESGLDLFLERMEDPEQRKKMNMREITFAAGLFHDKARVLDGKPTQIKEDTAKNIEKILKQLGEAKEKDRFGQAKAG